MFATLRQRTEEVWRASLPLRVVLMTLVASAVVTVLGGLLLSYQVTTGIYNDKRAAVIKEATAAIQQARALLEGVNTTPYSSDQRLRQVADSLYARARISGQYEVYLETRAGSVTGQLLEGDPIPAALRQQATSIDQLYVVPSRVDYTNGARNIPAIVVGARLGLESGEPAPIYFVFPLREEVASLEVLRQAVISVGLMLLAALCAVSYFVARTVATPVREAALAARRIASGHLGERMSVRGTDEFATLSRSMNHMAGELERQLASYAELARVQQRFVSDVSHELRTPLTTVRMAAEVLYEDKDEFSPVSQRSAELLQSEVEQFERLLADLLEISRFDAGAAELVVEKRSLEEIAADQIASLRRLADSKQCEVTLRALAPTEAWVDERRIQRIIRNLLTNAIEHGESRPVEVLVNGDDDVVAMSVRDHGVGFDPSQAEMVFHRFWRADPARARTVGGTGLGLAISLEDAQLHGGWLEAWGSPGKGACFRLTLPRHSSVPVDHSVLRLQPEEVS